MEMYGFSWISGYFQKAAENRAASHARAEKFDRVAEAIDAGDVKTVAEIAMNTAFTYRQFNGMVMRAILSDNVEIFNAVLQGRDLKGDPNYTMHFHDSFMPEGPHHWSESSLLYLALENRKANAAASLANNPKTDITKSGYSETSVYHSGGFASSGHSESKKTVYSSPLELARKLNMTEVIAPLARRTAELMADQAAVLMREAHALTI
jgi:hypothetical protein